MKNYNFFGAKIAKSIFFQFFLNKSLLFCSKYEWRFSWGFFWGILHFCKSKIGDFRIFASDFFLFWPLSLPIPPEAKVWASATSMRYQILAEFINFHMRYCLLSWDKNWSIQRWLFVTSEFVIPLFRDSVSGLKFLTSLPFWDFASTILWSHYTHKPWSLMVSSFFLNSNLIFFGNTNLYYYPAILANPGAWW